MDQNVNVSTVGNAVNPNDSVYANQGQALSSVNNNVYANQGQISSSTNNQINQVNQSNVALQAGSVDASSSQVTSSSFQEVNPITNANFNDYANKQYFCF